MFSYSFVPDIFHRELQQFEQRWQEVASVETATALTTTLSNSTEFSQQFTKTIVGSEFVAKTALDFPDDFVKFLTDGCTDDCYSADQLQRYVESEVSRDNVESFDKSLRKIRREFMWWVIWRDLNRLSSLEQTTAHLSDFASACLQTALDFHYQDIAEQWGAPLGEKNQTVQPFIILGMGKLGAHELNLSSDIDLIFAYPESGETSHFKRSKSNQEFFIRLGQKIIQTIDTVTADGFVFRVDMRLRPYGDSGALVMNFQSLENYYETQGREWERYAMIKARPVAQSSDSLLKELGREFKQKPTQSYVQQLMTLLRAFTYRVYVDFSAIDSLREMKQLINKEVLRKGMNQDVKLGAGGIREVEFIAQAFQLIRGGRDTQLQERSLLKVLPLLAEENMLPPQVVQQLLDAYRFLRNTEHAIQAYKDEQTQTLPLEKTQQQRLAFVMGFDHWDTFKQHLHEVRFSVNEQFNNVIADPEDKAPKAAGEENWAALWADNLDEAATQVFLANQGVKDTDTFLTCLKDFRQSRYIATMQATGRARLDHLMPLLLADICESDKPAVSLQRICPLLEAIARRSVYLVLLHENPSARIQLAKLCAASPWVAQELHDHPALLDELLDADSLYSPPELSELQDQLRREVLRINWDDLEGHMEALRYFHQAHALRVAASEIMETLPLMKVSDYLTWLAEVILQHTVRLCWQQLTAKHGKPQSKIVNEESEKTIEADFIVVGYGKLGGIELGHGSDLDLVFIHNGDTYLTTDGDKPIDNQVFFTRLGQKIIHFLNTYTVSGQLYEVDMRLRPSGNKGLLVSSLTAFEKYQREEAWVWEHQALVRARPVAGSERLAEEFKKLRYDILCQPRELAELQEKVREMRDKMRSQLGTQGQDKQASQFHLKQDAGGIVDIEFMVQYAVLAWAHQHPDIVQFTDNIRILECLERAKLLPPQDVKQLIEIYIQYRSAGHSLALQGVDGVVSGDQFQMERAAVTALWQALLSQ